MNRGEKMEDCGGSVGRKQVEGRENCEAMRSKIKGRLEYLDKETDKERDWG